MISFNINDIRLFDMPIGNGRDEDGVNQKVQTLIYSILYSSLFDLQRQQQRPTESNRAWPRCRQR